MKIHYSFPEFCLVELYSRFEEMRIQNPSIFYNDFDIDCVFGTFPGCIWNGGSINYRPTYSIDMIREVVRIYEDLNIPIALTFTNPLIQKEHLYDTYCNLIAELCQNGKNYIIVNSPIMEDYLRDKYPNYKYVKSILAAEHTFYDPDPKYYLTVMKRAKNNDWEYLDSIPQEDRSKIKFLCNDFCPDDCPYIYSHYIADGQWQLNLGNKNTAENVCHQLYKIGPNRMKHTISLKTHISHDMIVKEYLPRGYSHFKISGRTGEMALPMTNIIYYTVKPEYYLDAFLWFMGNP